MLEAIGEIDYILPQDILYMYRDEKVTKLLFKLLLTKITM